MGAVWSPIVGVVMVRAKCSPSTSDLVVVVVVVVMVQAVARDKIV